MERTAKCSKTVPNRGQLAVQIELWQIVARARFWARYDGMPQKQNAALTLKHGLTFGPKTRPKSMEEDLITAQ
jgi:hypothetical protein